jgi:hypothetical protein
MGPGIRGRFSPLLFRALAGIETGILGGTAMFGWLAVSSLLDLRSVWILPNVLGSVLQGRPVIERGFGWLTVSGLGLHLFVSGLVGLVFGLVVGGSRNRLRVTLLGIITGLLWYYFSQYLFWRRLGVLVMVHSPPRPTLLAHLLYGLALGWFPAGLGGLRRHFGGEAPKVETPAVPGAVE